MLSSASKPSFPVPAYGGGGVKGTERRGKQGGVGKEGVWGNTAPGAQELVSPARAKPAHNEPSRRDDHFFCCEQTFVYSAGRVDVYKSSRHSQGYQARGDPLKGPIGDLVKLVKVELGLFRRDRTSLLGASSRSCEGQKKSHNGQDKITRESPSRGWRARAKSPTSHELTSSTPNDDLRTPPSGLLPQAWGDVEWLWMGGRMGGWMI